MQTETPNPDSRSRVKGIPGVPRPPYHTTATCTVCSAVYYYPLKKRKRGYATSSKPKQCSDACEAIHIENRTKTLNANLRSIGIEPTGDFKVDHLAWARRNLYRIESDEDRRLAKRLKKLAEKSRTLTEPTMALLQGIEGEIELKQMHGNRIRARIASRMLTYLDIADAVILGQIKWTPTQARVFGMLLDKTLPNLSASYIKSESVERPLNELTREELEMIASGVGKVMIEQREAALDASAIPAVPSYDRFELDEIDEQENS